MIDKIELVGTEILVTSTIDKYIQTYQLEEIDQASLKCEITVDTDPIKTKIVDGAINEENGQVKCEAIDII